jgi:hypothetical protein
MHRKKLESERLLMGIFNNMKTNFSAGELSYKEFCQWLSYNPILVTPLHLLQIKLKKKLMGEKFWTQKTLEREKNTDLNDLSFIFKYKEMIKVKNFQFKEHKNQIDLIQMEQKFFEDVNSNQQQFKNHLHNKKREENLLLTSFQINRKKPSMDAVSDSGSSTKSNNNITKSNSNSNNLNMQNRSRSNSNSNSNNLNTQNRPHSRANSVTNSPATLSRKGSTNLNSSNHGNNSPHRTDSFNLQRNDSKKNLKNLKNSFKNRVGKNNAVYVAEDENHEVDMQKLSRKNKRLSAKFD